jgi:ectonucleotide pyrophosphatase/phosphodiesterase family protein 5
MNSEICRLPAVIVFVIICECFTACTAHEEVSRALLISLDGFRWDYLQQARKFGYSTPGFDRLISEGVAIQSPGIRNAFVTKTMPNHYTIVTGLYEENHGIVANYFFDPVFNETFDISFETAHNIKWWNGTGEQRVEPIWVTNDASGDEHRASGIYSWPGSEVDGYRPKYSGPPFNNSIPFKTRIDTVIGWFTQKPHPINFGAIYYHEPDATGHTYGPESKEVASKIVELDTDIGYLIDSLEAHSLYRGLNLIVTSDHGMQLMTDNIYLDDYIDSALYRSFGGSPVLLVLPKQGHVDELYLKLKDVKNLLVYKKENMDAALHYQNNRRISPIIVSAKEGFRVCQNRSHCDTTIGNHGYDNRLPSMHPIFIAHGPAFKKNYKAKPFDTVDIYPLLCHLLDLEPRVHDGSLDAVKHILSDDDNLDITMWTFLLVVLFSALISGIWCIGACRSQRISIRSHSGSTDSPWKQPPTNTFPLRSDGRKPLLVADDEEEDAA